MNTEFRRLTASVVGVMCVAIACSASAAGSGASDIAARKAKFKAMGADFKSVNENVRAKKLDAATLLPAVRRVQAAAGALPTWFPAGSGPASGPTHAKDAVWTNGKDFAAAAQNFRSEADKLEQVVRLQNTSAIPDQLRAVGQTCATCHAKFREKD